MKHKEMLRLIADEYRSLAEDTRERAQSLTGDVRAGRDASNTKILFENLRRMEQLMGEKLLLLSVAPEGSDL